MTIEDTMADPKECESISKVGVIDGCAGCADGMLLEITMPSSKETDNPKSCFSGHCGCMGVNVQDVVDSECRFTCVSVATPRAINDKNVACCATDVPKNH